MINGVQYRGKLLSRGSGKFLMVIDKALQKAIGFDGQAMTAHITMSPEEPEPAGQKQEEPAVSCGIDVLTAIKTRQSIRKFTSRPVEEDMVTAMLCCGLYAPTAQNKRPYHFIVIKNRQLLEELASQNPQAAMLADAAAQNILLGIHGLGLGGVWCGVVSNSDWRKLMIAVLELPSRLEPVAVIAYGWPDEEKELHARWELGKIHYDKW